MAISIKRQKVVVVDFRRRHFQRTIASVEREMTDTLTHGGMTLHHIQGWKRLVNREVSRILEQRKEAAAKRNRKGGRRKQ